MAQREETLEGPYLQAMPSEQIRNQLTHMARALDKACRIVCPQEKEVTLWNAAVVNGHILIVWVDSLR